MDSPESATFDREAALRRFQGRRELLDELIELLQENGPVLLQQVREAVAQRDPKALNYSAHSLKGMVGTFGAATCAEAALRLEVMGRTSDLSGAAAALPVLEREFAVMIQVLTALAAEPK